MPLSSLPAVTVRHVQTAPQAVWRIEHGQNGYPVVDVYTTENGSVQKIIPLRVEYVDANIVNIYFTAARTGFATVVV